MRGCLGGEKTYPDKFVLDSNHKAYPFLWLDGIILSRCDDKR